jgi:hypothetical protein
MPRAVRFRIPALTCVFALSTLCACSSYEHEGGALRNTAPDDEPRDAQVTNDPSSGPARKERDAGTQAPFVPSVVANQGDAGVDNPGDVAMTEPDAGQDEPDNDLTFACQTDADCNFGACYVPGGRDNPICSKRCDADPDCPEGALCAAPLSCTDGVGCEGRGYCFRACQTTDECLVFNPTGTLPGDEPHEVNQVNCIAWTDIHSDTEPAPPIDICIQHSEP